MKKLDVLLEKKNFCYYLDEVSIYHVGADKLWVFPRLEGFMSENTCVALSGFHSETILLPKYPVYQNGLYVGMATEWNDESWLSLMDGKSSSFLKSIEEMEKELKTLSNLGYLMQEMFFDASSMKNEKLVFEGIYHIEKSTLDRKEIWQNNSALLEEYLKDIVYHGMLGRGIHYRDLSEYLDGRGVDVLKRLNEALTEDESVSQAITKDIKVKLLK